MKNEIFLHTDRGEYIGGDVIYGTVFLNVRVPFEANSMSFEIKGYEKVWWEYHDTESYQENGETKFRTITKDHKGSKDFFKDHYKLINYPGGFPVGQWSYPFQYRLPDNLPGSFEKSRKNSLKHKFKIVYKIKAIVDISNTSHDLKIKQHLIVHEKLDFGIQPKHHDKTMEVRTCCCIPRGPVRCECWMDKNAYMGGETSQIHVKVDNNSAVKVDHFNSKLIRMIQITDGHHHTSYKEIIAQAKYDGTGPHSSLSKDIPLPLIGKKNKAIKPSTSATLVKCSYQIMIEMQIPWAPDLEIYSPITIYAPQSAMWSAWQPPQWIAQAQTQQVCNELAVPQDVLNARVQNGVFQPPANYQPYSSHAEQQHH